MKIFLVVDEHCFDFVKERNFTAFANFEDAVKEFDKIKERFNAIRDKYFIEYMDGITIQAHSAGNGMNYIDACIMEMEVK